MINKIIDEAEGCVSIIEIGPGPGVLTRPLSECFGQVTAVEIDERMPALLEESSPKANVLLQDALKTDFASLISELDSPCGIVSNMPYNITGPLLTIVAEQSRLIDRAVLMMQKEVAERITAPPGDRNRGSLSVYLESQFTIRRVCKVPPGAFLPPPKVESAVLRFDPLPELQHGVDMAFFKLVRQGFSQPRKTVTNCLSEYGKDKVVAVLDSIGQEPSVRPHQLELKHWIALRRELG